MEVNMTGEIQPCEPFKPQDLLARAKTLHETSEPIHTYQDLLRITALCDMTLYQRTTEMTELYRVFYRGLRTEYGSTETYLLDQLGWTVDVLENAQGCDRYFTQDVETSLIRIRRNDWPYAIPKDFEHWLVWSLRPLLDWRKADRFVQSNGLASRIWLGQGDSTSSRIDGPGNSSQAVTKEIEAFVKAQWPEAHELFWHVNPINLQSVPGIAHFHVYVRMSSK